METLLSHFQLALRSLRKNTGFATVAILTLALGIGANAAIFTVAKRVLLDPLPLPEPDRVMSISESNPGAGLPRFSAAPLNFRDYAEQNTTFDSFAAYSSEDLALTAEGALPERLGARLVSGEYFKVYGVSPILGRTIGPEDDQFEGPKIVVLGFDLWQRRFGGEDVLGKELILGGEPHTAVGVMPKGFHEGFDVFVPLAFNYEESSRGAHFWGMRGRLAEGVSEERGLEDLKTIAARLEQEYPETNTGWTVIMSPLRDLILRDFDSVVWMLFGAVFLVLLIACTNVANLLLARMATREKEVALRSALGASRGQILGQFLAESLLLAFLGGGLGLLLAAQGTKILVAMNADGIPRSSEIQLDLGVVLFTLVLSLLTGLIFGLLPALRASRPDLAVALKEGGRGQAGGFEGKRVRQMLVLGEVALAVVLLVGAGLLLRSFSRLMEVDPGFQAKGALTAVLELPAAEFGSDEAGQSAFFRRLFDDLAALPGVESAGGVIPMPLTGSGFVLAFGVEGEPPPKPGDESSANMRIVSEDYFHSMGIPLKKGRIFERSDEAESTQVMVVNERFVERYLPGKEPIGQRLNFGPVDEPDWITIIGVVGDVHHEDLAEETDPEAYWPYAQRPFLRTTMVVRTAGDPMALVGPVREVVRNIDPNLPVYEVRSLEELVATSVSESRFRSLLLALFAGLALLLAAIGVYGVISYGVSQQRKEIGVRMALGAARGEILRFILKGGLGLVGIGVVVGLVASYFAGRVLESMVYDMSTRDFATYGGVAVLIALVGLVACLIPARRATRVDPVDVLQAE